MSFKRLAGLSFGALVVAGLGCAVTGCGSGTTEQQVEVSPEFTDEDPGHAQEHRAPDEAEEAGRGGREEGGGRGGPEGAVIDSARSGGRRPASPASGASPTRFAILRWQGGPRCQAEVASE